MTLALLKGRLAVRASTFPKALATLTGLLILANVGAWIWALAVFRDQPVLLATALLAYGFGVRHAFDADHIAAIDNVTRKLMQEGQRPLAVGLFFSLGHSTVVVLAVIALANSAIMLSAHPEGLVRAGGILGTIISALFLFAIAFANLQALRTIWRHLKSVRKGTAVNVCLAPVAGGLLSRIFGQIFRLVRGSWQMYPLGFLFALGFDTATEVALLGISAAQTAKGLSIWSILTFPALFAAGMSLVDTANGMLMLGAYNWAFPKLIRTLYYNLAITLISIVVAFAIGCIQILELTGDRLALSGGLWDTLGVLTENFDVLGLLIVGLFSVVWVGSVVIHRYLGADDVDAVRIENGPSPR
jgi:high-affinity nickel-transport protein